MALFPLFAFVSVVAFEAKKKIPVRAARTLQIQRIAAQGYLPPLSEAK
jgi:hypothetical protein